MTTTSDLYTSRLPDGLFLITVENVRDEMARIGALFAVGQSDDVHKARVARCSLLFNALLAVHRGHPDAKAIVAEIVGVR